MSTVAAQPESLPTDRTMVGIAFMVAAVAIFPIGDGFTKYLAGQYHPVQIAWTRYLIQSLVLLPLLIGRIRSHRLIGPHLPMQGFRAVLMLGSTLFFTFAVTQIALADATAVWFVAPLLVTLLSVGFLGEKIRIRRGLALVAGFIGVLIIVRPGTGAFQPATIFSMLAAVTWALAFVITRKMGPTADGVVILLVTTLGGLLMISPFAPMVWRTPEPDALLLFLGMSLCNVIGQYMLIRSSAYAPPSLLAPFSYTQLVWATIISMVIFATVPDQWTVIGATILVGSGLYIWHRERVLVRQARAARTAVVR